MDRFKTVGQRLRHYRDAAGYTQKAFAEAIGIRGPSLSDIESGESKNPAALTLLRAAALLGLDPMYLLTGEGVQLRSASQLRQDEIRLLLLYRELPQHLQHELESEANRLHTTVHTRQSPLNPYPRRKPSKIAP